MRRRPSPSIAAGKHASPSTAAGEPSITAGEHVPSPSIADASPSIAAGQLSPSIAAEGEHPPPSPLLAAAAAAAAANPAESEGVGVCVGDAVEECRSLRRHTSHTSRRGRSGRLRWCTDRPRRRGIRHRHMRRAAARTGCHFPLAQWTRRRHTWRKTNRTASR